jgi:hypothetical protein
LADRYFLIPSRYCERSERRRGLSTPILDSRPQPDDLAAAAGPERYHHRRLHYTLQIAFDWSDLHLHRFHIHGQDYGISRSAGVSFSSDPRKVHLGDFRFRINERFLYEYDFGDRWEHEVRIERRLPLVAKKIYPVCIGGRRAGPEEDCGGPWAYMEYVDDHWCHPPLEEFSVMAEAVSRLLDAQQDEKIRQVLGDMDELREAVERVEAYQRFQPDRFDRQRVNRRLKQICNGR